MVLFRSVSASAAFHMFSSMFGANGIMVPQRVANLPVIGTLVDVLQLKVGKQMFLYSDPLMLISPLLVLVLIAPNIYELMGDYETALTKKLTKPEGAFGRRSLSELRWRPNFRYSVFIGVLAFISVAKLMSNAPSEFIYFRF
jgi:hypothetical protein